MKTSAVEVEEMRAITERGVKDAPLPVKYEAAKQALAECSSVDECSTWAKKAAALASYARQADDRSLEDMAARIRARAIRRCGELLKEIPKAPPGRKLGDAPPPISARAQAAQDAGLSRDQTKDALRVARIPARDFEAAVESESPPTITELADRGTRKAAPVVDLNGVDPAVFNRSLHASAGIRDLSGSLTRFKAADIAAGVLPRQRPDLIDALERLIPWLGTLLAELEEA